VSDILNIVLSLMSACVIMHFAWKRLITFLLIIILINKYY